ncbi:MAG: hypothetical protein UT19_C0001G0062 [Candidatus Woesebacteria bacterium GW2011_GWB1_39_10b]|uniref:Uncharacterized protein n=1 Tax=Candidatus Woesebacteria bacterium GW2011_GWB1_39_10b TaxID=1618573 RepID=A0A0G0M2I1_9BACT|nr:MAG: hypothetical protein UT19_C0001G0062 [Candidatus Woesebacteria bacterium GW2011_GWB1_39_10b]
MSRGSNNLPFYQPPSRAAARLKTQSFISRLRRRIFLRKIYGKRKQDT